MKDRKISILSTRPLDEETVSKASEHQIIIDCISFIETQNIIDENLSEEIKKLALESIAAVFTSMNGAEAVIEELRKNELKPNWEIYCIGAATQSLIKDYFVSNNIKGTAKSAAELSEIIVNNAEKEVLFFCGNQRREELPKYLQENKVKVKEVAVYETNETPVEISKSYNGILFFSPSAVKSFFSVNSILPDAVLFSIGNTTAVEIKKHCSNKIFISDFPSKDKLVKEAIVYFDSLNKSND